MSSNTQFVIPELTLPSCADLSVDSVQWDWLAHQIVSVSGTSCAHIEFIHAQLRSSWLAFLARVKAWFTINVLNAKKVFLFARMPGFDLICFYYWNQ